MSADGVLNEASCGCGHALVPGLVGVCHRASSSAATHEVRLLNGRGAPWSPYAMEQTRCSRYLRVADIRVVWTGKEVA
jgi:hypothetical protein